MGTIRITDSGSDQLSYCAASTRKTKTTEAAKTNAATVRVGLPYHLRNLAHVDGDVVLEVNAPVTLRAVLDTLEARYPVLRGTIREYETGKRRAFLRFFACEEDWSLESPDKPLPDSVAAGKEPLLILGAIAGGSKNQGPSHPGDVDMSPPPLGDPGREQGTERTGNEEQWARGSARLKPRRPIVLLCQGFYGWVARYFLSGPQ
jgi:hypothetical protein